MSKSPLSLTHCFALHSNEPLPHEKVGQLLRCDDKTLQDRILRVLRLHEGDFFILFDKERSLKLQLLSSIQGKKGGVCASIIDEKKHQHLSPHIHLYIGMLKKEALEKVVYDATVLGATSITPIITDKVHRTSFFDKENDRLIKIMIAAAEQSKQFIIPTLKQPIPLEQFLNNSHNEAKKTRIHFDPAGKQALQLLNTLAQSQPDTIDLFCGPEGGLTNEEITLLNENSFYGMALSPTVLRSTEAVTVGLGIMRSCLML